MSQYDIESKVYSATTAEDDHKLYEITSKMKEQADKVLFGYSAQNVVLIVDNAKVLAESVEEFLKVSGWARN